ncbi:MAG: DNA-binding protein [Clostridiales bacterium]|nr:DNA-binding protein [Clostridiales bacterium]
MNYGNKCVVVWKDLQTRQRFIIGEVSKKNDTFVFKYSTESLAYAEKRGFKGLVSFPDKSKEYVSTSLFPAFLTRLPDRRRSDIKDILSKYKLKEYDAFELLKVTEGRTPIDTLEFIVPIDLEYLKEYGEIRKEFFAAGIRHCDLCEDRKDDLCTLKIPFEDGEELELVKESTNPVDKNAILLYKGKHKVGYIPRYYSESLTNAINHGLDIKCVVKEFNQDNCCQECLKLTLIIK